LRVGIGVHFLSEGLNKLENPKPFSGAFFSNAKGPLNWVYKGLVWDADGEYRLDPKGTLAQWDNYRNRVVSHYGFDDQQKKKADEVFKAYEGRLKQFFSVEGDTIHEYFQWVDRRKDNAKDKSRELASLQTHDARIASETRKLWSELIPPIDRMWKGLEDDLNDIATTEQWERHGRLKIGKPGRLLVDSETMDTVVPWFDLIIGGCLILGLFTRVAGLLGAAFLASVCVSQWPLSPGAIPIYYQAVEMLALLALAAIGAGRYLGLDFILGGMKAICCPAKNTGATK